jgi:hypothetical protein
MSEYVCEADGCENILTTDRRIFVTDRSLNVGFCCYTHLAQWATRVAALQDPVKVMDVPEAR